MMAKANCKSEEQDPLFNPDNPLHIFAAVKSGVEDLLLIWAAATMLKVVGNTTPTTLHLAAAAKFLESRFKENTD